MSLSPFLVGAALASIMVLAVVIAIVIARSGGSDVAEPHWPLVQDRPLLRLLAREDVIRAYASCRGRYRGDERRTRVESATASLDEGRRTFAEFQVIISIECPPAWAARMGNSTGHRRPRTRDLARLSAEVVPAACFEGGGHQVQGPSLLERGKLEHPPEDDELPVSDGIRRPQGDGEAAE